jgi:predicted RNA binding protein YcfA (HicA-like mRNA interferase family)
MAKTPRLTARQVIAVLRRHGFEMVAKRGSHEKWRHPESRRQVIVPDHRGKVLPIGTLRSIMKGSGIPEEEWQ